MGTPVHAEGKLQPHPAYCMAGTLLSSSPLFPLLQLKLTLRLPEFDFPSSAWHTHVQMPNGGSLDDL